MVTYYFSWWYGAGWKGQAGKIKTDLSKISDLFSISLLLKTLFAPFHQYSANDRGRGINDALRAWTNRTFSRLFGFVVRTLTIFVGLVSLIVTIIFELLRLLIWPLLPVAPIIYVILIVGGVF